MNEQPDGKPQRIGITPEPVHVFDVAGMPAKEIRVLRTTYAPGGQNPKHYHSSHVVFYVLEGAGVWQEDGKEPVTLKPGDIFHPGSSLLFQHARHPSWRSNLTVKQQSRHHLSTASRLFINRTTPLAHAAGRPANRFSKRATCAGQIGRWINRHKRLNRQMRSIVFDRFGEPDEVLEVRQLERPLPDSDEIIVHMNARPINPSDLFPVRGAYRHRTRLPGVPGYEGVGVVVSAGQATAHAVGQRVLALRGTGTWQEYVCSPASYAIPVPDSIPDRLACQLYINPLSAWLILTEELSLNAGDVIVANGGGSAFAHVMVQFARLLGFRVILVTRSPAHSDRLTDLGAYAVVDTSVCNMRSEVMALTRGKGAAAALDAVGGTAGAELAHCVAAGGAFISYGLLSGEPLALSYQQTQTQGISVRGFWLRQWLNRTTPAQFRAAFDSILSLVMAGDVVLREPAYTYALDQVREAVQVSERSGGKGKVILTG